MKGKLLMAKLSEKQRILDLNCQENFDSIFDKLCFFQAKDDLRDRERQNHAPLNRKALVKIQ